MANFWEAIWAPFRDPFRRRQSAAPAPLVAPPMTNSCGNEQQQASSSGDLASGRAYAEPSIFYSSPSDGDTPFWCQPPLQAQPNAPVFDCEQAPLVQLQQPPFPPVYADGSSLTGTTMGPVYEQPCCSLLSTPSLPTPQFQSQPPPAQECYSMEYEAAPQPVCARSSYSPQMQMQQPLPLELCHPVQYMPPGLCCGAATPSQPLCAHQQDPLLLQQCNSMQQQPFQQQQQHYVLQQQPPECQPLQPQQLLQQEPLLSCTQVQQQQQQLEQRELVWSQEQPLPEAPLLPQEQILPQKDPQQQQVQQEQLLQQEQMTMMQQQPLLQRSMSDGSTVISACERYGPAEGNSEASCAAASSSTCCCSSSCQIDVGCCMSPPQSPSWLAAAGGINSPIQQPMQSPPSPLIDTYAREAVPAPGSELMQQQQCMQGQPTDNSSSASIDESLHETQDADEQSSATPPTPVRRRTPEAIPFPGIAGLLCLPPTRKNTAASAVAWHVGFRSPLGKEGRAELIKRMRVVHRNHREFCSQTLSDLGICFRRLAHARVEELWQLAYQWGLFEFGLRVAKKSAHWVQHDRHKKACASRHHAQEGEEEETKGEIQQNEPQSPAHSEPLGPEGALDGTLDSAQEEGRAASV